MKPPSRHRHLPSRLEVLNKTESKKKLVTSWDFQNLNKLILALKQHNKLTKLDVFELRKKVPKCSLPEIQNMIKSLKKQVARQVYQQVRKQKREELKFKVPIKLWEELAQRMAGAHVETLSSAFSQMLVIAATEPCSLLNSNPPRSINTPDLLANKLQTVPMRPLYMSPSASTSPFILPMITLSVQTPSNQTTGIVTLQPQPQKNASESDCVPEKDSMKPLIPKSPANSKKNLVLKSTPLVSTLKAVSNTPVLLVSSSKQLTMPLENGHSNQGYLAKSAGIQNVVDFEKIYQFLCNTNNISTLTAMESAVVLDLLMSLPEELPLLDCKELQHHLLQEYTRLKTPSKPCQDQITAVDQPSTSQAQSGQTVENINPKGITEQNSAEFQKPGANVSSQLPTQVPQHKVKNDEVDWATVGLCPLNPFMVPVALLKRQ